MANKSRYRYFDDVWNDDINHIQKGHSSINFEDLLKNNDDNLYTIKLEEQYRPDILATRFYGDPKLFWVLIYVNNIENSPEGFYEGRVIRVPRIERVLDIT